MSAFTRTTDKFESFVGCNAAADDQKYTMLGHVECLAPKRVAGQGALLWSAVVTVWVLLFTVSGAQALSAACPVQAGAQRAVTAVLDGGVLRLDDGSELVLAGILPPRPPNEEPDTDVQVATLDPDVPGSVRPAQTVWPPAQQTLEALKALTIGKTIEPSTIGRQRDRYGRMLAQVSLVGSNDAGWLQGLLVARGLARVTPLPGLTPCTHALLKLEQQARATRVGLWANIAYAPKSANRPRDLLRQQHQFVLVEGRVLDVADRKRTIYLNFGTTWRDDFTVEIDGRARSSFSAAGMDPLRLKGRSIRVRGWIEYRGGPMLSVTLPEQIELLDGE
jgi:micrococcal nuclease